MGNVLSCSSREGLVSNNIIPFPIVPRQQPPSLPEFVCYGRPDFLASILRAHHGWAPEFALLEARRLMAMKLLPDTDDRTARRALCDAGYMPTSEYVGPEAS
jgi:hypothetical protein